MLTPSASSTSLWIAVRELLAGISSKNSTPAPLPRQVPGLEPGLVNSPHWVLQQGWRPWGPRQAIASPRAHCGVHCGRVPLQVGSQELSSEPRACLWQNIVAFWKQFTQNWGLVGAKHKIRPKPWAALQGQWRVCCGVWTQDVKSKVKKTCIAVKQEAGDRHRGIIKKWEVGAGVWLGWSVDTAVGPGSGHRDLARPMLRGSLLSLLYWKLMPPKPDTLLWVHIEGHVFSFSLKSYFSHFPLLLFRDKRTFLRLAFAPPLAFLFLGLVKAVVLCKCSFLICKARRVSPAAVPLHRRLCLWLDTHSRTQCSLVSVL